MAEIIPSLNKLTLGRMTAGERRVARRLEALLEDDYLVWYDIPIGRKRRYPDFIILHPSRGLLFLEVKDWKPETLKQISKTEVRLLTDRGLVTESHPLEQARQYAFAVINTLQRDPQLCEPQRPPPFRHRSRHTLAGQEHFTWTLPDKQSSRTGHATATAQLLRQHPLGNATTQNKQDARQGRSAPQPRSTTGGVDLFF